jgi:nucleoside-diphosphate-sugar epimerase
VPTPGLVWRVGTLDQAPWEDIRQFAPDVCIHTAWIATPGVYLESPDNFQFVTWSLDFLRRAREVGVRRVVVLGTCIEYQIGGQPLSEQHTPVGPTTTYARCKNDLRLALEQEATAEGFQLCWGRVFYPYGVGEHPSRLCSSMIQKLGRGEPMELQTPQSMKDYIHIEDLAAAIVLTAESSFAGVINWGTGEGVAVRQVADTVAELLGRAELVREQMPPKPDPLGRVVADADRIKSLGWMPHVGLREGLKGLIRAHGLEIAAPFR